MTNMSGVNDSAALTLATSDDDCRREAFSTTNNNNKPTKRNHVRQLVYMIGTFCMFMAFDFVANAAMTKTTTTRHNHQVLRRRHLEDIPIGEQVEQAIQDSMESGELGADNPAVVNVSWVPLGTLLYALMVSPFLHDSLSHNFSRPFFD